MDLSKETVAKIRDAEAQAEKIRNDAAAEAKAKIQKAHADGKKLCEKAEADAARDNAKKLEITQQKADELLNSVRAESAQNAATRREEAEFNMREAVRYIISGVDEQCQ